MRRGAGLAFGADVPVLPVDTLLAVAEEARWSQVQAGAIAPDAPLTVLALLDARMDEVYSAAYRWEGVPGSSHGRWQEAAPLQVGAPEKLQMPDNPMVLLAGNAFAAYGERLPLVAPTGLRCEALPTAAALLRLAPALWGTRLGRFGRAGHAALHPRQSGQHHRRARGHEGPDSLGQGGCAAMSLSINHASSDEGTQLSEATRNRVTLAPMSQDDLDAVIAIEQTAYSHPWTRGNFRDSLNPLFMAQCLWLDGELLGYFLAMHGVE